MTIDPNVNNNVSNYNKVEDSQIMNLINPQDWDPRKISYAMIFILVLVASGMSPLEQQMEEIAKNQSIIDGLDSNIIDFSAIISQLESESGKNGFASGTTSSGITQIINELKSFFKNTFGSSLTAVNINGTTYYLPQFSGSLASGSTPNFSGSAYGNMIESWMKQNPGKSWKDFFTSSPAVASINSLAGQLYGKGDSSSWAYYMEGKSNTGFSSLLSNACKDYYDNNNPTSGTSNTTSNPLKQLYTWASASQGGLQGIGSQNTAIIQTDTSSETSLDQTGQNANQGYSDALNMMIQNQKAQ